jgi:hypothetical protein
MNTGVIVVGAIGKDLTLVYWANEKRLGRFLKVG